MTQQESDTSIRILRDRLALANQNCVAAITELRTNTTTAEECKTLLAQAGYPVT